jgi:hypothetical protein
VLDTVSTGRHICSMATMIVELYDALKSAGAPEDKAQAAAVTLAATDERFDRFDAKLTMVQVELATVKAELGMVKWIVSGVGFGIVLLILKSFWPSI